MLLTRRTLGNHTWVFVALDSVRRKWVSPYKTGISTWCVIVRVCVFVVSGLVLNDISTLCVCVCVYVCVCG